MFEFVLVCTVKNASVSACVMANTSEICTANTVASQILETQISCTNGGRTQIIRQNVTCTPNCPGKFL